MGKLRPIYPCGERKDIIRIGKILLKAYKERFMTTESQALIKIEIILNAQDNDAQLGLKYYDFHKEFESIYFKYIAMVSGPDVEEKLKKLIPNEVRNLEQLQLENAIYSFSNFAGFAL